MTQNGTPFHSIFFWVCKYEKEVCNCNCKTKQNKQNGEGRRQAISIYTNNNNLTKLCNRAREGGKTNLKKRRDEEDNLTLSMQVKKMFHLVCLFNEKKKFANLGRGKTKRAKKKGGGGTLLIIC
jgi:hypothetical protein